MYSSKQKVWLVILPIHASQKTFICSKLKNRNTRRKCELTKSLISIDEFEHVNVYWDNIE